MRVPFSLPLCVGLAVGLAACTGEASTSDDPITEVNDTPPADDTVDPPVEDSDTDSDSDSDADSDDDSDSDADDSADSAADSADSAADSAADTGPDWCANGPPITPIPYTTHAWPIGAEDFDIDQFGRIVAVSGGDLKAYDPVTGATTILSVNVGYSSAGTRILPNHDVVIATGNNLVRVDMASGVNYNIFSGLSYPNGMEVDDLGYIYVAEQSGNRLRQINPNNGNDWMVATGLNNPNGVVFDDDYDTIYVNSFGGGTVWQIERTGEHTFDPPGVLAQVPAGTWGAGSFDGLNIDVCDNVYVTDYSGGKIWMVEPNGNTTLAADPPSGWIPNMRWGNGVNGMDPHVLYVTSIGGGTYFGLQIGMPGKPPVYWP